MHILLLILKIIGITLAVIVGLVLLILLIVLFLPFGYRSDIHYHGDPEVNAKVSWLFRIIQVDFSLKEKKTDLAIRLFGFRMKKKDGKEKKPKKRGKGKKAPESGHILTDDAEPVTADALEEVSVPEDSSLQDAASADGDGWAPEKEEASKKRARTKKRKAKKKRQLRPLIDVFWDLTDTLHRRIEGIRKSVDRVMDIRDFATSYTTALAVRQIKRELMVILRHMRPRHLKIDLAYGMKDPALTGQICGAIGVISSIVPGKYRIEPDFENERIDADIKLSGHLMIAALLPPLWRLYRSKEVKWCRKEIRRIRNG